MSALKNVKDGTETEGRHLVVYPNACCKTGLKAQGKFTECKIQCRAIAKLIRTKHHRLIFFLIITY